MAAKPSSPADNESVPPARGSHSGLPYVLWGIALVVLALNFIGGGNEKPPNDDPLPPRTVAAPAPPSTTKAKSKSTPQPAEEKHLPRAKPTRLLIPQIGVDAPFIALATDKTGKLEAPPAEDTNLVGWHAEGASPGELGTSLIAGHVDTTTSPAVFAKLSWLEKGDEFAVERADGRMAEFVVDDVERFAKNAFPDEYVYADTRDAQVRLITCAGAYDRTVMDYTENLVVFAHLL
ncbi:MULTISPECIES: class F sortase [Streptomyces]|uniref:Class F sortase n=1 Tax=Streptomyces dengpaensis TaxID=2049881 RepID=A0ABM6SRL5_9ACTN|nr:MULTISPECIES: class F sortase [Streptomyces]AVH57229.1 class F sortase [Streptomyces dengpaensis]PIA94097.1 class F sortase [Streptomyces sp. HG99]